eukprot:4385216-Pyramimonas_sp.AAC.1
MGVPPAVINFGVNIGGRRTDGVTYTMFLLSTKSENFAPTQLWYCPHGLPSPCGRTHRPVSSTFWYSPL